jgi:hypothetical protein
VVDGGMAGMNERRPHDGSTEGIVALEARNRRHRETGKCVDLRLARSGNNCKS